jgi:hypothetical protein
MFNRPILAVMDVVSEFRGIPPYKISLFAYEDGTEPVRRWLGDLTPAVRRYVGFMLNKYVQRYGPDVSATQFGKNLGGGLYEFRLDAELVNKFETVCETNY